MSWNIGRRNSWERQVGWQGDSRPLRSGCVDSLLRPIAERKLTCIWSSQVNWMIRVHQVLPRRIYNSCWGGRPYFLHIHQSFLYVLTSRSQHPQTRRNFVVLLQKGQAGYQGSIWDEDVPLRARTATLEPYAVDESASVQVHFLFWPFRLTWNSNYRQLCIRWLSG